MQAIVMLQPIGRMFSFGNSMILSSTVGRNGSVKLKKQAVQLARIRVSRGNY